VRRGQTLSSLEASVTSSLEKGITNHLVPSALAGHPTTSQPGAWHPLWGGYAQRDQVRSYAFRESSQSTSKKMEEHLKETSETTQDPDRPPWEVRQFTEPSKASRRFVTFSQSGSSVQTDSTTKRAGGEKKSKISGTCPASLWGGRINKVENATQDFI